MGKNNFMFVRDILRRAVSEGVFPSAACAIGIQKETLFLDTAGHAAPHTLFDAASLTKVLSTTMIALRAIEDGLLTLQDPVSLFFEAPEDKESITIQNLLTHTGGFTPFFLLEEEIKRPEDVVSCILSHPLEAPPDGMPRYSCIGYILLGKILEKIYGQPLDVLARKMVFQPLAMHQTGYVPGAGEFAPTEVDCSTGIAWRGVVHDENARFLHGVSGNAGVFTNITDCARYASMLARGGRGFLSAATFQKAIHNYTKGHDTHRGLGFHLAGSQGCFFGDLLPDRSFGHTGFTGTSIAVEPESGLFIVLLSNRVHPTRDNSKILRFRRVLHNVVYAHYAKHHDS